MIKNYTFFLRQKIVLTLDAFKEFLAIFFLQVLANVLVPILILAIISITTFLFTDLKDVYQIPIELILNLKILFKAHFVILVILFIFLFLIIISKTT